MESQPPSYLSLHKISREDPPVGECIYEIKYLKKTHMEELTKGMARLPYNGDDYVDMEK